jgi:uncharacterized membrane protein
MSDAIQIVPSPPPVIGRVKFSDLSAAMSDGFRDFLKAPAFGLFFSAFYAVGGVLIYLELTVRGEELWVIPIGLGFPLLAPFAAVGLYEVSRRLEKGESLDWSAVLGVVFRQKDRQFPSMAMMMIMFFMFWVFVAHLVFALFMGLQSLTNILTSWQDTLLTPNGLTMLAIGTGVGAAMAFVLFSLTVISLPLLLEREIDFISAMICSFQLVLANPLPMLAWGAIVSVLLFAGMLPFFLGLFIVLPVCGHATWHLYRRVISFAGK